MSTLRDLVEEYADLEPVDIDHLRRVAADWQLLSDLTFAEQPGEVLVRAERSRRELSVTVSNSGCGLPEGFDLDISNRLGLQIVRSLATGELRGTIALRNRAEAGVEATLEVQLSRW
ncbi:MAG: histidine kinase N-terminal domain-containing protein [Longispora sp.]|nr:histidine kinase N-terminal domain-containing protein [Longispora sp. (in: high G+C Gram-positive bacteria)]